MEPLITMEGVQKYFRISKGIVKREHRYIRAVDDVSLQIRRGEVFGLVGESGSGKTTIARLIPQLTRLTGGTLTFDDVDVATLPKGQLNRLRQRMGMVFQDPASSMNPRATLRDSIIRPLQLKGVPAKEAKARLLEVADRVNIGKELLDRYPHELSGGEQQRASVARAIILNPELLILDEPTSALDVSVQAQILNLLLEIREEFDLTYFFITHNLSVVRYISDRIGVMYLGKLMEVASVKDLYERPLHPYTLALLSASPPASPRNRSRTKFTLVGDPPSLINPPTGCRLHPRCTFATDRCRQEEPVMQEMSAGHWVSCHRADELDLSLNIALDN